MDDSRSIGDFFTENVGQVANDQVLFYTSGGMQVGFAESAVLFVIIGRDNAKTIGFPSERSGGPIAQREDFTSIQRVMIRLTFDGSRRIAPQGMFEESHRGNYFIGNDPANWRTGVRNYREIAYRDLYEGIDLIYRMGQGGLKYDFVVSVGADPARIRMTYEGFESMDVRPESVVLRTAAGEMRDDGLLAVAGSNLVRCDFIRAGMRTAGFECNGWNDSETLVIDPLVYSTYLGGGNEEQAFSVATDGYGNAYVTGIAASQDFPLSPGAFDVSYNGGLHDAFVAKLKAGGAALAYSTFLGGGDDDYGEAIAVDVNGSAYVVVWTHSSDIPTTPGAYDAHYDYADGYLARLSPNGSALMFATFLGGSHLDYASSVAIDPAGNAFVAGWTFSSNFPTTAGAFDRTYNGGGDSFVAKLDPTGHALLFSTFIGGKDQDCAHSIAVNPEGDAYVSGFTSSSDFPTTPAAFDRIYDGGCDSGGNCLDGFVAKLAASGGALGYSTFLGGGGGKDSAGAIVVNELGEALVTGLTTSPDFPTTAGAFDATYGGGDNCPLGACPDAFLARLDSTGRKLLNATFVGGTGYDYGNDIGLGQNGEIYMIGLTKSLDFPTTHDAIDTTYNGFADGFVTEFDANGTALQFSTYLGGAGPDQAYALAVDSQLDLYVVGLAGSHDFPITPGAFDTSYGPGFDAFVTKFGFHNESVNTAPFIESFSTTASTEGVAVVLDVTATDAEGDSLTYAFDFESDGVPDIIGPNHTVMHVYGDDFNGTAIVSVSDGNLSTEATTQVIVLNVPPTIDGAITATATFDLTLRVAGEKWHDVTATIHLNGEEKFTANVVRTPGSPDDQAVTVANVTCDLTSSDSWSARVVYTPLDDPGNGQVNGASPAWLIFTAKDGSESRIHHTFNVRHDDTWIWEVPDLRAMLLGMPIDFAATATDPGSDDLTFTWDWGDGTPAIVTTYYNDGIGLDSYPSPDGAFPFTATDSRQHAYATTGTYTVTLKVTDDDGGATAVSMTIQIGG